MKYVSTRGKTPACSISEAIVSGIAPDGGLFIPESWPQISVDLRWAEWAFSDFAFQVLAPFFEEDRLESSLKDICQKAFNFPLPLKDIGQDTSVLELFHGPTNAFKDFGARFLALATEHLPPSPGKKRMVLVATSGDTGGAVASAFYENTKIPVTILFPKGKVSERQEKQLTSWGSPVKAFSVRGNFDDCQKLVKETLTSAWAQTNFEFISANSINIGRLLPQMAYFAFASLLYFRKHQVPAAFVVPSGNLGNSVGLLWAQKLGFPIRQAVFAHNSNRAVADFFSGKAWSPQATIATLANAMDVGNPSNFERVQALYPNLKDLQKVACAVSVSDQQIQDIIKHGKSRWSEIWCPHTATAVHFREQQTTGHYVVVATAHPAKFETIVEPLIGQSIAIPENLKSILAKPSTSIEIDPHIEALKKELTSS